MLKHGRREAIGDDSHDGLQFDFKERPVALTARHKGQCAKTACDDALTVHRFGPGERLHRIGDGRGNGIQKSKGIARQLILKAFLRHQPLRYRRQGIRGLIGGEPPVRQVYERITAAALNGRKYAITSRLGNHLPVRVRDISLEVGTACQFLGIRNQLFRCGR